MNEMTSKNFHAQFQTFDDPQETSEAVPRLVALRAELARRGLDGFVVPHADRFQNEYLPPNEERLAWLTGFTGSAGAAVILAERAALGRVRVVLVLGKVAHDGFLAAERVRGATVPRPLPRFAHGAEPGKPRFVLRAKFLLEFRTQSCRQRWTEPGGRNGNL